MKQLLHVSTQSLCPFSDFLPGHFVERFGPNVLQLLELLRQRNGFFAFESSLHVYPLSRHRIINLCNWNEVSTWKYLYSPLLEMDILCFAQDAFGNQFGITEQHDICVFDVETAQHETIAPSIDAWTELLMADWREYTGQPLAHDWQIANRQLDEGERLVPKVPFVVGGDYSVDNLYAQPVIDSLKFRASLAHQVAELPDGTPVTIRIVRPEREEGEAS